MHLLLYSASSAYSYLQYSSPYTMTIDLVHSTYKNCFDLRAPIFLDFQQLPSPPPPSQQFISLPMFVTYYCDTTQHLPSDIYIPILINPPNKRTPRAIGQLEFRRILLLPAVLDSLRASTGSSSWFRNCCPTGSDPCSGTALPTLSVRPLAARFQRP